MPELTPKQYALRSRYGIFCSSNKMKQAGYVYIIINNSWNSSNKYKKISNVCCELFGDDYIFWTGLNLWWFRTKEDAVMFKLVYGATDDARINANGICYIKR